MIIIRNKILLSCSALFLSVALVGCSDSSDIVDTIVNDDIEKVSSIVVPILDITLLILLINPMERVMIKYFDEIEFKRK